jgi:hypothetical protein
MLFTLQFITVLPTCLSQWPRGLRRRRVTVRLLGLESLRGHLSCEFYVLFQIEDSATRPEESYRLWCVVVCELETSIMRRPWPALGLLRQRYQLLDNKVSKKMLRLCTNVVQGNKYMAWSSGDGETANATRNLLRKCVRKQLRVRPKTFW